MSREPFFEKLADEFSDLMRHRHYHQHQEDPDVTATFPAITGTTAAAISIKFDFPAIAAATEAPMSFADIETEIKTLADHAKRIEHEILPAAAGGLKKLEGLAGNPVVLSLLSAVHVPTEALAMAVKVIDGLEELYKPETAVAAPSEPAVPVEPAAPAEPAAAA